jgi:perosamine synthetase
VIPHNRPTLGQREIDAAAAVLASGWLAQGRQVQTFEEEVCRYLGLPESHAVAVSSGTAALFLALWALGATGKRVAIPVYSCAAVRNAVLMAGAEVIPIDVADDSPNLDLEHPACASADIIVAAHMHGLPTRWLPASVGVPIVEDCSQAFGARIDGRPVGANGAVGVFSFYATKMFTSGGQGGMCVSSDRSLIEAVRDYRQFDCRHDRMPRFNLQMTDLQAAVGRVQLGRIEEFIGARRAISAQYHAAGLPLWIQSQAASLGSCCYRAIARVPDAPAVAERLRGDAIGAIVPVADWELLGAPHEFPRAAALSRTCLSLPLYPSLTKGQADAVIRAVSRVVSYAASAVSESK